MNGSRKNPIINELIITTADFSIYRIDHGDNNLWKYRSPDKYNESIDRNDSYRFAKGKYNRTL